MERLFFFIAFVLVVGVGFYFFQTGLIQKNISSFTSFLSTSSTTHSIFGGDGGSGSSTLPGSLPKSSAPGYGAGPSGAGNLGPSSGGTGGGTGNAPQVNSSDLPPGFTANQVSLHYHQFRISGSPGQNGVIQISNSLGAKEFVDVTGWSIRTNRGGEFIPQAVNLYNPFGTAVQSDIKLGQSDTLTIYANSAPTNLRLNKCVGYLNDTNQWNPQLPLSCPSIDRSEIQSFTGACQNYILSVGGCQTANLGDPRIPQNDFSCRDYIASHFSYRSCYDAHVADADFLSHQVWVWAGSNPLDPFHDRVMLLDAQGNLVDYFTY